MLFPRTLYPHLSLLSILLFSHGTHALWPQPRSFQTGSLPVLIPSSFTITVDVPNAPPDLLAAAERARAQLDTDQLARLVPSRGAEDLPALANALSVPGLTIRLEGDGHPYAPVRNISDEARAPLALRNEQYSLSVPSIGSQAVITAPTTLGLFRGLNAFVQLWYFYDVLEEDGAYGLSGPLVYMLNAPILIQDWPTYVRHHPFFFCIVLVDADAKDGQPYRGFMLDTARN